MEMFELTFYRCQRLGSNIVRSDSVLLNTLENALVCLVLSNVAVFEDTAYVLHSSLPEVQASTHRTTPSGVSPLTILVRSIFC